jgi:hypothetical protein
MDQHNPVGGRNASALKYDILTAIAVRALTDTAGARTTALRLIALITARYDWRRDEVSIGRNELAQLWKTSEATAKRELGKFKSQGLLEIKRPGVRGRVAAYRLCHSNLSEKTRPNWDQIGGHFTERMADFLNMDGSAPKTPNSTVEAEAQVWRHMVSTLSVELSPAVLEKWILPLIFVSADHGTVVLRAPSAFQSDIAQPTISMVAMSLTAAR